MLPLSPIILALQKLPSHLASLISTRDAYVFWLSLVLSCCVTQIDNLCLLSSISTSCKVHPGSYHVTFHVSTFHSVALSSLCLPFHLVSIAFTHLLIVITIAFSKAQRETKNANRLSRLSFENIYSPSNTKKKVRKASLKRWWWYVSPRKKHFYVENWFSKGMTHAMVIVSFAP